MTLRDDLAGAREELREALEAVEAKATEHRERAQRTAISGEDWRFTNGYDRAIKDFRAALAPDPGAAGEPNDDEPGGFVMAGAAPEREPEKVLAEALEVALTVALHETFDPGCTGEPPYDSSQRLAAEVAAATMRSPLLRVALAPDPGAAGEAEALRDFRDRRRVGKTIHDLGGYKGLADDLGPLGDSIENTLAALRDTAPALSRATAKGTAIDVDEWDRPLYVISGDTAPALDDIVRETMNELGIHPWFPRTEDVANGVRKRLEGALP